VGTPLSAIGEFGLIAGLRARFQADAAEIVRGIGDDAAVVSISDTDALLISSDMLMEGVHFDRSYGPILHLGYKACMVNFSDIHAMNARPFGLVLNLAVGNRMSTQAWDAFYTGVEYACREAGVTLLGGDTTSTRSGIGISVTVFGRQQRDKISYRSGAQVHDVLCVTGDLGAAYAGLQILEREKQVHQQNPDLQPDLSGYSYIVERQLRPSSTAKYIDWFAERGVVPSSMIDVSDGLASEVNHLARESGLGARVLLSRLPIDYETSKAADEMQVAPGTFALYGGEDYELLFTVSPTDFDQIKDHPHICPIGFMTTAETGVMLVTDGGEASELKPLGYHHFQS